MADTAVVAKPLVAPTPEKGKKKKSSSGKEKSSKRKEKKEEATKDAMELEQPVHKPKRKFDEHTHGDRSADKGKQKAIDVDEDKSSGSSKHRRLHIEIAECSGPVRPSLAIFPNGPPPLDKLHNEEDGIKFGLWENTSGIRTKKMMVAETDKMLYLGQPTFRDPFRYFIMTVDKSTSTAKMIPVADFFHMQQQIKGYTPQLSSADDVERSYLEQRLDLIERFGSKKKKSQVNSARANKINADAVSNAEEVMATISEKATQKAEAEVTSELYPELPPYNKTASEPDGVYPLNDIIPYDLRSEVNFSFIIDAIDDYAKRSVIERKYGAYIAQRTKALGEVPLGEQERQARLLTVIAALVKLRSFLASARRSFGMAEAKSATDNLLPEALLQHFLPLFASAESARRFHKSPLGETRLTSYIIVLLLHSAQDWTVQVAGVSELLTMPPKDAQKYIVSVGCRVAKAAPDTPVAAEDKLKAKRYVLVAPLVLPSKAQRSGKKKGR